MKWSMYIGLVVFICTFPVEGQPSNGNQKHQLMHIDKEKLMEITRKSNDTTYVVNFWATWCSPCIKEIGFFEELHKEYESSPLQVILVSLDFPNQVERRLVPFLKEKEITAQVALMTDLDYNNWIDSVDPSWSGAIPATLIFNKDNRMFFEKEVSRDELFNRVNQILQ
jgi:thiol-disulfide isomerase/thioredoxin